MATDDSENKHTPKEYLSLNEITTYILAILFFLLMVFGIAKNPFTGNGLFSFKWYLIITLIVFILFMSSIFLDGILKLMVALDKKN